MGLTLSGPRAEVRWAYHVAAVLVDWQVVEGTISARIESSNPVRLEQSPLSLVIENREPFPAVRRRLTEVRVSGATFIARLGPKE